MAFDLEKEKIPDALYKVADFIKEQGSWFGSAMELIAAIGDDSIPANQMAKQIIRHYYEVFYPECIKFEKPGRKNNVRGIRLYVDQEMLQKKRSEASAIDDEPEPPQSSDDSDDCDGSPPSGG